MSTRPHGREEVRRAILSAAKKRFASQGPSASLRDIAADADVNLGLLHRHFGTKKELIRAVFADAAAYRHARSVDKLSLREALDQTIDNGADRDVARMLAGMLLAGSEMTDLWDEFPSIARFVELGGEESRGVILTVLAAALGWQVFDRFLVTALGYQDEEQAAEDLSRVLRPLADRSG